jgi:hypothetical protein
MPIFTSYCFCRAAMVKKETLCHRSKSFSLANLDPLKQGLKQILSDGIPIFKNSLSRSTKIRIETLDTNKQVSSICK